MTVVEQDCQRLVPARVVVVARADRARLHRLVGRLFGCTCDASGWEKRMFDWATQEVVVFETMKRRAEERAMLVGKEWHAAWRQTAASVWRRPEARVQTFVGNRG